MAGIAVAGFAFCVGGLLAEYFYPGLVMVVAAWAYCRHPNGRHLIVWLSSVAALVLTNANFWALAAAPVLLLATRVDPRVPRLRWLFYAFYPLHLAALWWLRDGHKLV